MCRTCPLKLRKSIEPYQQIPLKVDKSGNIPLEPQTSAFHWGLTETPSVVFKAHADGSSPRTISSNLKVELPLGVLYWTTKRVMTQSGTLMSWCFFGDVHLLVSGRLCQPIPPMEFIILVWRWTWKHTLPEGKLMNMGSKNQIIWGWLFCWATTYQWCWCLMYSFLLNCYWLYQEISAKACGNPQTISIGLIPGPPSISREDWPPPRSLSSRSPRRILYDIMVTSLLVSLIGWSWWYWGKRLILWVGWYW